MGVPRAAIFPSGVCYSSLVATAVAAFAAANTEAPPPSPPLFHHHRHYRHCSQHVRCIIASPTGGALLQRRSPILSLKSTRIRCPHAFLFSLHTLQLIGGLRVLRDSPPCSQRAGDSSILTSAHPCPSRPHASPSLTLMPPLPPPSPSCSCGPVTAAAPRG